jgi:hypothetical protein
VWNVWLGGTDNFPVDRELAGRIQAAMPSMPLIARFARLFLADAVHRLSELGVRQFLDIGSGVPTADNTHQVAQRLAPESRVVYADRDPTVARHARSLLRSTPAGATDYLHADLRDPEAILDGAGRTLDRGRSVAVFLIAVLSRSCTSSPTPMTPTGLSPACWPACHPAATWSSVTPPATWNPRRRPR